MKPISQKRITISLGGYSLKSLRTGAGLPILQRFCPSARNKHTLFRSANEINSSSGGWRPQKVGIVMLRPLYSVAGTSLSVGKCLHSLTC